MHGTVEQVERLTPSMVRVVLGGDGLDDFEMAPSTDAYVNLLFLPPQAPYAVPFDLAEARALDRDAWPVPRRFSVRAWDEATRRLTIDFVVHGDEGTAGRWARPRAPATCCSSPGRTAPTVPGPPPRGTCWWATRARCRRSPPRSRRCRRARRVAVLLVDGPDHELALKCPGTLEVVWLHRERLPARRGRPRRRPGRVDRPFDGVQAFVHGEAVETRAVRRHLLADRGVPREALSVSPYWRRTMTDERWREVKQQWLAEVEQDA